MDSPVDPSLSALEALQLLGTLGDVTRRNLPAKPAPRPGSLQATVPAAASAAPPAVYTSSREEYKAALQDRSLIEALLALQGAAPQAGPGPNPAAESPEAPEASPEEVTPQIPGFVAAEVPEIQAEVKPSGYFRKSSGIYHPILRPARPAPGSQK